jgi:hypothetical protein
MKKAAAIRGLSCIMPMYMIMPVFYSNSYSSKFISKIMPVYMKPFCLSDMSCIRDFYFRALGSLVVLSFPQPLNFFSVFPLL